MQSISSCVKGNLWYLAGSIWNSMVWPFLVLDGDLLVFDDATAVDGTGSAAEKWHIYQDNDICNFNGLCLREFIITQLAMVTKKWNHLGNWMGYYYAVCIPHAWVHTVCTWAQEGQG